MQFFIERIKSESKSTLKIDKRCTTDFNLESDLNELDKQLNEWYDAKDNQIITNSIVELERKISTTAEKFKSCFSGWNASWKKIKNTE